VTVKPSKHGKTGASRNKTHRKYHELIALLTNGDASTDPASSAFTSIELPKLPTGPRPRSLDKTPSARAQAKDENFIVSRFKNSQIKEKIGFYKWHGSLAVRIFFRPIKSQRETT
jgi:hypothetical protein